jgi:hypothetical protein
VWFPATTSKVRNEVWLRDGPISSYGEILQDFKPIQKISSPLYCPARQSGAFFAPAAEAALGIAGSGDEQQELLA